jgi:hypothetical protein
MFHYGKCRLNAFRRTRTLGGVAGPDTTIDARGFAAYRYEAYWYQPFLGSNKDIQKSALWRYMTFEKFCWLVEKASLYHARLDRFEDPFEGSVTAAYARNRENEELAPGSRAGDVEPWTWKCLRYQSLASCWHASEGCESDAQWKIYAPGGVGIAVVSSMERLLQSVSFHPHMHGILGQVEYTDFEQHDMGHRPFGTQMSPGFAKRKSFEHEREVRGIILADLIVEGGSFTMNEAFLEKQRREQPVGISAKVDSSAHRGNRREPGGCTLHRGTCACRDEAPRT